MSAIITTASRRRITTRGRTPLAAGWYVSNDGDDDNVGRSSATAFATYERLLEAPIVGGDVLRFAYGSTWREELSGLPQGVILDAYGNPALGKPMTDGRETVLNASFEAVDGYPNVYRFAWTHDTWATDGTCAHRVWEAGVRMRRAYWWSVDGAPVVEATALAAVRDTPGSFWAEAPTATGPDWVYVHATASANPISSGVAYLATKRRFCVDLRTYLNHAEVYNLQAIGNAHADGAFCVDGVTDSCTAHDGRKHNFFFRGQIIDCIANGIEPPHIYGGATMFVGYDDVVGPSPNGRHLYMENCRAIADAATAYNGATNQGATLAYFAHNAGPEFAFGTIYMNDCYAEGCAEYASVGGAEHLVVYKGSCEDVLRMYHHQGLTGDLVVLGGNYRGVEDDFRLARIQYATALAPVQTIFRGVRGYFPGQSAVFELSLNNASFDISRCTLVVETEAVNVYETGNVVSRENVFHCISEGNFVFTRLYDGVNMIADRNLYNSVGGVFGVPWQAGYPGAPATYQTKTAWTAATGQDAHSVVGDPMFAGNPAEGDFTFDPASPAMTLGAGADYEGEDADEFLQGLLRKYTADLTY